MATITKVKILINIEKKMYKKGVSWQNFMYEWKLQVKSVVNFKPILIYLTIEYFDILSAQFTKSSIKAI